MFYKWWICIWHSFIKCCQVPWHHEKSLQPCSLFKVNEMYTIAETTIIRLNPSDIDIFLPLTHADALSSFFRDQIAYSHSGKYFFSAVIIMKSVE